MTKSSRLRIAALGAIGFALALPAAAQEQPTAPTGPSEVQTGSRIQTITVIGAMRDRRAARPADRQSDRRLPELPVSYEDAQPGR
ncbi:MAG: hypothetical protein E6G92_00235 [Alphaproteobacteria bacterium]|nr:MAG: hypothetical protein E6G92_00235 [Alphaproteobacteria bacterium]